MSGKKVLLAGLFHETHTFLDGTTKLEDFQQRFGEELLNAAGDGSPLAACVEWAERDGVNLLPAVDMRAKPSAIVEDEVVERFWAALESYATPALQAKMDGILLVLHGAMCSQNILDVEGEILERLRKLPGAKDVPVVGVLDLHCNFTERMAQYADCLVSYRENPHTDAHQAASQAAHILARLMNSGERPKTVWVQPPLVLPPTGTGTADEPMRTLESYAREMEKFQPDVLVANVFGGFAFADTPDTGLSLSAVTLGDPEEARLYLQSTVDWAMTYKELGFPQTPPIDEIIPKLAEHPHGPIILVEPSDNIGGGAPGDGTGILRALVRTGIENAAVVINDPEAVLILSNMEPGGRVRLPIGGKGSRLDPGPLNLEVELESLSDGRFDLEDRHSHLASMMGVHIDMGPCAVVRHQGIRLLLTSRKTPPFDLGQLRSQGIVPERLFVIGVKAAVAHRQAYDPITTATYTVSTPGPCSSDLRTFPFQHLRRPVYPLDELDS